MSTMDEIYRTLGLRPALEFESERRVTRTTKIGTTTRMLAMALVDLIQQRKIEVHMCTQTECAFAQRWLWDGYCKMKGENVNISTLRPFLFVNVHHDDHQRDTIVYRDHSRDPLEGIDVRTHGVYAYTRYASAVWGDEVELKNSDQQRICSITRNGFANLQLRHFVNIEII